MFDLYTILFFIVSIGVICLIGVFVYDYKNWGSKIKSKLGK